MVSQSSSQTTQYVWEKALIAAQSVSSIAVISSSLHGLNERPCGLSCAIVPVWAGTIFVCFVCCMGLLHAVFIFFIWSLWVNEVELLWCHLIVVSILSARCWGFFFFCTTHQRHQLWIKQRGTTWVSGSHRFLFLYSHSSHSSGFFTFLPNKFISPLLLWAEIVSFQPSWATML